jgi:hypothetical protein
MKQFFFSVTIFSCAAGRFHGIKIPFFDEDAPESHFGKDTNTSGRFTSRVEEFLFCLKSHSKSLASTAFF